MPPGVYPRPSPETRFWRKVDRRGPNECWHWLGSRIGPGYGEFWANGAKHISSRFSFELANGPIAAGLQVLHSCDNPPCVNPAHLTLGTALDNSRDMIAKRRSPAGERNPMAKLRAEQVAEMRALATSGRAATDLGIRFGIAPSYVRAILRGERWAASGSAESGGKRDG